MVVKLKINGFQIVKTRDRVGGTIRTSVYELENGLFQAFSHYQRDDQEETIGFAESYHMKEAIRLSRKDLRNKWEYVHK